ncbi:hypothetical protein F4818DRAFT_33532 [Hypoxylon cercidicola]|nr:hypothetical protein F4818DRAFT_33532 [Hypoxylon cercidicola]
MDVEDASPTGVREDVDLQPRFTKLRQFVSGNSFSAQELRYLKILLSEHGIDVVGELPIELVIHVAELLDLSDFTACLAVSRRWREVFLSSPVLGALVNIFCPSFAHRSGSIQTTKDESVEALRRIKRARCAGSGPWHFSNNFQLQDESYFKLDPEYHNNHQEVSATYAQYNLENNGPEPLPSLALGTLYSSGKVAWQPKPLVVVVDSFWSRTRKIFSVPAGSLISSELGLLTMGNQLVVGSMDRHIVAWDHVQNVYLEKRLPGSVKRATTEGSRVAIVLYSGDVFLWEFGGNLKTLATAPLVNYHGFGMNSLTQWRSNLTVVFHPTCNRTLFLASAYDETVDSRVVLKRVVYEFNDAQHIKTFEIETAPAASIRTGRVWIRKVLPYRRDIIGFCEQPFADNSTKETFAEFDIYDRKFTARVDEEFDDYVFGWRSMNSDADLDFSVSFSHTHYVAASHQPGFHFGSGQASMMF